MSEDAMKDLAMRMADDALIYGHRNAEWTGLAPTLEEDIAFSSTAQDKFGHAQSLYQFLQSLGGPDPDTAAFMRDEKDFRCCHFVEFETMDYAVALMRHFLFDTSERLRYGFLESSSVEPLAQLARKIRGEIKYHTLHARTWVQLLGAQGNEESRLRMQSAANLCYPIAFSMFEPSAFEDVLRAEGIFVGESVLKEAWKADVAKVFAESSLVVPEVADETVHFGGRRGYHSDALAPLIAEMTEVYRIDPTATW
ncbi:MAG: 1,2-phenylacetyl-CoA epoxidase subunit PaaC [Candidatus Kapaibacterium sp.]